MVLFHGPEKLQGSEYTGQGCGDLKNQKKPSRVGPFLRMGSIRRQDFPSPETCRVGLDLRISFERLERVLQKKDQRNSAHDDKNETADKPSPGQTVSAWRSESELEKIPSQREEKGRPRITGQRRNPGPACHDGMKEGEKKPYPDRHRNDPDPSGSRMGDGVGAAARYHPTKPHDPAHAQKKNCDRK